MKKSIVLAGILAMSLWAVDYSQMTTQQLTELRGIVPVADRDAFRAEMQKRIQTMTPQELDAFRASRQAQRGTNMQNVGMQAPSFAEFDTNNDGKISQAEMEAARAARMEARANEGKLLKNAGNAPAFNTIDANQDGFIDATEFQTHQQTHVQSMQRGMMGGQGQGIQQRLQDGSASGQMMRGANRGGHNRP